MTSPESGWLPGAHYVTRPIGHVDYPIAPEEALLVAKSLLRRREHFAAGRAAAHEALRLNGYPMTALLRSDIGAPAWPADCVGSIAHCEGMAAAIVAAKADWAALGIDIEPDRPLPDDVADYTLTAAEHARLAQAPDGVAGAGLISFSAKECVHKCVHPLRGVFLEFGEVEIDLEAARFTPRPLSAAAKTAFDGLRFEGRWLRTGGFVWTLLALR